MVHHAAAMYGRYSLTAGLGELALRFDFDGERLTFQPAYNVAATQGRADRRGRRDPARRVHALGFDTALGEERLHRKPDDQRQG